MRQTDLQILDDLIADNYKPYIESALKRIRSVYVESRHTVRAKRPAQQRKAKILLLCETCADFDDCKVSVRCPDKGLKYLRRRKASAVA